MRFFQENLSLVLPILRPPVSPSPRPRVSASRSAPLRSSSSRRVPDFVQFGLHHEETYNAKSYDRQDERDYGDVVARQPRAILHLQHQLRVLVVKIDKIESACDQRKHEVKPRIDVLAS